MLAPIRLATAVVCALLPLSALAETTAEQAQSLQQDLRGWVEQTFGSDVKLPEGLVQVTPEADHFQIAVRPSAVPGLAGIEGGDMAIAAQPLPSGRWLLYDFRFASPFRLHVDLPETPPAAAGAGMSGPLDLVMRLGRFAWDGMFDPAFASPSVVRAHAHGYELEANAGKVRVRAHADALRRQWSLIPAGGNRIDVVDRASLDDFGMVIEAPDPQQSPAAFIGRIETSATVTGLDRDRVLPMVRSLFQASSNAVAANSAPDQSRASLRDVYAKLRDIAAGGGFHETLEDLRIESAGHIVDLARMALGAGIETPNGVLTAHLTFALDGLAAPDVPAEARAFVPQHVLIRPSISGIDLADMDALIMAATEPGAAPSLERPEIAERVKALFSHGGISAGLDRLEVDLGATHFGTTGKVTALSPEHFVGEAEVTATGFDALIAEVQASPEWGKAVPFLQLLGKLGRAEGGRVVWTISADNADVKLNGIDIPALIAAGKGLEKH